MTPVQTSEFELIRADGHFVGRFFAMASPCEILVDSDDLALAHRVARTCQAEAQRVERKFSRYRTDNVIHRINTSGGRPVEVDHETADLLDYADVCHQLSEGCFDITSGVLRKIWRFDGSDAVPAQHDIETVLPLVGWHRVRWRRPWLTLPAGMELDLGGIGKEYAVDRAARLCAQNNSAAILVNFGGDLVVSGPRRGGVYWTIGLEDPRGSSMPMRRIAIKRGGLATSGDARRFLLKDGIRYGHILDPRTGWPVPDAPRSVTVAAETCLEAGILATFAILHGANAEHFLRNIDVSFWLE